MLVRDLYGLNSSQALLYRRRFEFYQWLADRFDRFDHDWITRIAFDPEYSASMLTIIDDSRRNNDVKINKILEFIHRSAYFVGAIHAHPGMGKSTLAYYVLSEYKQRYPRQKICFLGMNPNLPSFFDKMILNLNDIPQEGSWIVYCDEFGKYFPSRDSGSDSTLQSWLIDARHFGLKLLGCVQQSSLVDVTLYRFLTAEFYKYMNVTGSDFDREAFARDELKQLMIPKDPEDKKTTLAVLNGTQYLTFTHDVPSFQTEELSKVMSTIGPEEKDEYAMSLLMGGMTPVMVQKRMAQNFKHQRPKSHYEDMLRSLA